MKEFSFTVSDVLDYLALPHDATKATEYIDCPVCHGKKKLYIHYSKNFARCNKCGIGGGMLTFAQALMGCTRSEAASMIAKNIQSQNPSQRQEIKKEYEEKRKAAQVMESHKAPLADIEVRDRTYSCYLDHLDLSEDHLQNLLSRGLTAEAIKRNGYKTVPAYGQYLIAEMVEKDGCQLSGVPLFYRDKNKKWLCNLYPNEGFYVPVRDLKGRILGLQIRRDHADKNKYIWATSWSDNFIMDKGSHLKDVPKFHHVGFEAPMDKEYVPCIGITEGPLKADVSYALGYHIPIIALCGLSNQLGLYEELSYLKENFGLTKVLDLTDMDKFDVKLDEYGNEKLNAVKMQTDKICSHVQEIGLTVDRYKWNREYKGIDDYIYAVSRKNKE